MDASKLINGSGTVLPAKSGQPSAVRSEATKVDKRPTGKKTKTKGPTGKGNQKIEIGETRLPLLRQLRLGSQLHQATRSPMPQMFQQALRVGGSEQEGEGQEVDLLKTM